MKSADNLFDKHRTGPIARGWFAPNWRLGPAPMMMLPMRAQNTVEARLGCQMPPLIGHFGHDLGRRKAGKLWGTSKNHLAENFNAMKSASYKTEESETLDF